MAVYRDSDIGAALVVAAVVIGALSYWDTVTGHLPASVRPYADSPVTAVVLALAGIYFLWRGARAAEQMARDASAGRAIAEKSNQDLQRRVEAAETKLLKALDEQMFDWAPAVKRIDDQIEEKVRDRVQNALMQFDQTVRSYARRAERGYLPGDDISKPPPGA